MIEQPQEKKPLTLVAYSLTNFEGIKDVLLQDIPPGKYFIALGGDNAAGKSSLIKGIAMAILGKPTDKLPIRQGANEARAELVFDRLKVIARCFTVQSGKREGEIDYEVKIQVNTEDGWATLASPPPAERLKSLVSSITFDIGDFLEKKDAEQVQAIRNAFRVDTTELDSLEAELVDKRKVANADVDRITKRNAGMKKVDAPEVEEDASALIAELQTIQTHNAEQVTLQSAVDKWAAQEKAESEAIKTRETSETETKDLIKKLQDELKAAQDKLKTQRADIERCEGIHEKTKEHLQSAQTNLESFVPESTAEIEERIKTVDTTNANVRENKRIDAALAEYQEAETRRAELEKQLLETRNAKKKLLFESAQSSGFAFPGFEIRDTSKPDAEKREYAIWIDGLPLRQHNTETKIRFATSFGVMEKPMMRIFALGDGEKITPKNMEIIRKIAEESKTYIFTEIAVTAGEVVEGFRTVDYFLHEGRIADPEVVYADEQLALEKKLAEILESQEVDSE